MSYASLDELRSQLGQRTADSSVEYAQRMLHKVPDAPVVDRAKFILKRCEGRRVLEFGASGPLHDAIRKSAAFLYSSDYQHNGSGVDEDVDLDEIDKPYVTVESAEHVRPDLIVCGEVIEHLTNPGYFLRRMKTQYVGVPVIITTPNAFGLATNQRIRDGVENVNADHVAWYSYTTLKVLLDKCGYSILDWAWYRGQPYTAEGLVVVCV